MSMDYSQAQPTLDGLAPKKKAAKKVAVKNPAALNPVARVALDVQAAHLGRTFDYLIEEKDSIAAVPGVRVRVRFGGKLRDGFIWERVAESATDDSLLKYIERVVSPLVAVNTQLRKDIDHLAAIFGGTRANLLRVAIPPRIARVEREKGWKALTRGGQNRDETAQPKVSAGSSDEVSTDSTKQDSAVERCDRYLDYETRRVNQEYAGVDFAREAFTGNSIQQVVWDCLPGPNKWAGDLAWTIVQAISAGKSAVVCLPNHRAVVILTVALKQYGLTPLAGASLSGVSKPSPSPQQVHGPQKIDADVTDTKASLATSSSPHADFAIVDSNEPQELRYRSHVALSSGAVRVAIGTRAAMYAPVTGPALFAVLDDNAYQNTDGFMPYANVRDVLLTRAHDHRGIFLSMGLGRSPASQYDVDTHPTCVEVHGYPEAITSQRPWIRWLNPEELSSLGDPTAGSRVPHTVSAALTKAAAKGPVLIAVPYDGFTEVLACSNCRHQARCRRCSGPLRAKGRAVPVCAWCAQVAVGWTCRFCGGEQFRPVRIGAQGTAAEIKNLFRGVPLTISTPNQPRGVVMSVPNTPRIVIATPGAQPRVEGGQYQALAILDAWTSMYSQALDARVDTLNVWMNLSSLVVPASQGGQVQLVGQCDPALAQSLVSWDPRILARKENQDRLEAGLPPAVAAASVWGKYSVVMETLEHIGALDGDFSTISVPVGLTDEAELRSESETSEYEELPSVMGPLEISPEPAIRNRQLEGANDRVRAIVRVRLEKRDELAARLHLVAANRAIRRDPGELRFWMNPKDLRQR